MVLSAMEALFNFFWTVCPSSIIWNVAVFLSAIVLVFSMGCWYNTQHDVARKIPITIRFGGQVLPLGVSSEQTVGELKKSAAKMFGIADNMHSAIFFRLRSKILHD